MKRSSFIADCFSRDARVQTTLMRTGSLHRGGLRGKSLKVSVHGARKKEKYSRLHAVLTHLVCILRRRRDRCPGRCYRSRLSSRKGGGRSAWGVILNKFSSADACLAGASLALSNRVRRTCRGIGKVVDLAAAAIIASAGYFRVNAGIAWNGVQFIADCFSRDARVQTTLCARAAFVEEVLLALESWELSSTTQMQGWSMSTQRSVTGS